MILMTRSTMNCSKVEDNIILCRSKWQVLDRLADVILNKSRLQLLTITQSRLVILHYRIRSARLNDIEVIYLGVWITLLNQICKMGTDEAGTASDNIIHCDDSYFCSFTAFSKYRVNLSASLAASKPFSFK